MYCSIPTKKALSFSLTYFISLQSDKLLFDEDVSFHQLYFVMLGQRSTIVYVRAKFQKDQQKKNKSNVSPLVVRRHKTITNPVTVTEVLKQIKHQHHHLIRILRFKSARFI